jgi:hypothetical protein
MAQKDFDDFVAELRNFAKLWQSGTLSCIAVGGQEGYISLASRIVLSPDVHRARTVLRFLDLTDFAPPFFAAVVQYPIEDVNQLMYQLVANGSFQAMVSAIPDRVYLTRRPKPPMSGNMPASSWLPPGVRSRSVARDEWSIDRPMKVLIWRGPPPYDVITPEQMSKITARLKGGKPTPVAGIAGLIRELMPGAPADLSQGFVQIAAPLPFDLSFSAVNGISVEAPKVAFENGMVVSIFYRPSGSERHELHLGNSVEISEKAVRRWQGDPAWPPGAEGATVELLYNDNEVDTLAGISRGARAVRAPEGASPAQGRAAQNSVDNSADWEQIGEPLGEGGQSQVLLVRRPARVLERTSAAREIREVNPWHTPVMGDPARRAHQFAAAIWKSARPDTPSELGAMKLFNKLREAGPEGERRAVERLKSEIEVLRESRPGLPKLLAANEVERWIVTEYFPQGSLERQPHKYRGKTALALKAFRSLVKTVASLHGEKIVHRDIKPANVFIREDDQLVLGDFGIVYLPNQPDRHTRTDERVGPRDYMPPWADRDERLESVEPNFDVYMLGKLLWCMVAGRLRLFREEHHSAEFDLAAKFSNDPDMHIINSVLDKCVVAKPGDCLESARELLKEVDEALRILERGGQVLSEGVPRPCHVCGKGFYRPGDAATNRPQEINLRSWARANQGYESGPMFQLRLFTCDVCGHVELFAARR